MAQGSLVDIVSGIIQAAKGESDQGITMTGEPVEPIVINPDVHMQTEAASKPKGW